MKRSLSCKVLLGIVAGCAATSAELASAGATAVNELPVQFENDLKACVEFTAEGIDTARNVLLLKARMHTIQNIGECGCKSAVLSYRVRRDGRPHSSSDTAGRMNTLGRKPSSEEHIYFVLATDAAMLSRAKTVTVDVTCTDAG